MDRLKVCFAGIGSIAQRHIMNLADICLEQGISLTVDALRRYDKDMDSDLQSRIRKIFTDSMVLDDDYDVIFITNPTSCHLDTLRRLHGKARHFFIEKPLTSYDELENVFDIGYRGDSIYYVACPLRHTAVIQYMKQNVYVSDVIAVRCISSSYLPDWRPGTDYRKTYSADGTLGGGVSTDLIHEWDYIKYLFGRPDDIFYTSGKKSSLELACEDYAIYVADYPDKVVELHLDYFGRETLREVMLFTHEDTIVGDLANSKISYLRCGKEICFREEKNDCYKKELAHFLDMIKGTARCDNSIRDAYETLLFTHGKVR